MIAWAMTFFAKNKAVILNYEKTPAQVNLKTIKDIIEFLPEWMTPGRKTFVSKSETKTTLELFNGSVVRALYPKSTAKPDTIARSLTVPILYIDESAFIRHMDDIFTTALPTLTRARVQATNQGYPWFILVTSTPNGTVGHGKWFFDRWNGALNSDELFIKSNDGVSEIWNPDINVEERLKEYNSFIKVRYHWSEGNDDSSTQEWYEEQKREMQNERKIAQELDIVFVGGTDCIFSDTQLDNMHKSKKDPVEVKTICTASLKIFDDDLDPMDYYLIGCDTSESMSMDAAYCTIEIFSFKEFKQVAELKKRFPRYFDFGETIHQVFQWLYKQVGNRIILNIENNSIGRTPIEYLLYHVTDFNYEPFLYKHDGKNYGTKTSSKDLKILMFGLVQENINEFPDCIHSEDLINEFSSIIQTSTGAIKPQEGTFSDLAMATCFCAIARKFKLLEILPLIEKTNKEIEDDLLEQISFITKTMDLKQGRKEKFKNSGIAQDIEEKLSSKKNWFIEHDYSSGSGFFPDFTE